MYKEYNRLLLATILFGSLWGFSECIIGSILHGIGLYAGAVMTGLFAIGLMYSSRLIYGKPGMQMGMGVIASIMRLSYPFGECYLCSAIAILTEAIVFELIWYKLPDIRGIQGFVDKYSLGVITAYAMYISGYIVTQVLTPIVSSAGFYIENLIVFLPQILGSGFIAAILGGLTLPLVSIVYTRVDLKLVDRLYYPVSLGVSFLCWFSVLFTTLMLTT